MVEIIWNYWLIFYSKSAKRISMDTVHTSEKKAVVAGRKKLSSSASAQGDTNCIPKRLCTMACFSFCFASDG